MTTDKLIDRPVALVTGGRRGIGAAIVLALVDNGFNVAFTGRSEDEVAAQLVAKVEQRGGRALAVASELQDIAAHRHLLDRVLSWGGRLDCLVNNAGIGSPQRGDLLDLTPEAYDQVLDTNLRGTFFLTQAVARHMVATPAQGPRSIVTVSSVSVEMASPERGEYCLSKAGLGMLNKLFTLRLARSGIGVFDVRPGVIRTDMTSGVAEKYERRFADGLVPMQRWGEAEEVARVVASLAQGSFGFATGSVIHVDGGLAIPRL
jgi:NAD(P)-dependent dehydrogenase (short-subunit alcohol dehydrogenase family)